MRLRRSQSQQGELETKFSSQAPPKNRAQVLSKVSVCFYVNNIQVSQDFHVISGRHEMILGLDFLCKYGVQVDFGQGNVSIGNTSTKLSSPGVVTCLTKSVSSVTLPKRHEVIVPVKCTRNLTNRLMLFNQTKGSSQVNSFTVTDTVTTVNGSNAYVRVLNKSPDVIVIPKGTVIAFGQSLNEADLVVVEPGDNSDVLPSQSSDDIVFNFDSPDISDSDKHKLSVFLKQNREVFAKSKVELNRCTIVRHQIDTGSAKPVCQRFYRTSPDKRAIIDDMVQEYLDLGFIEPSTSEWRSPVVLVKKADGSWRLCCDYRKLNTVTRPQSFPLPRLEDVWDAIGETKAKVYSVLDMSNGFHQCAMDPASVHKSAFVTQNGQFQWNVLPYGLCNSPITFMRTVHQVLRGLLFKTCVVYVDDIVVYSNNMADHLTHLQEIFDRLKKAGLKLKPSKCHFAAKEVKYLGHLFPANRPRDFHQFSTFISGSHLGGG